MKFLTDSLRVLFIAAIPLMLFSASIAWAINSVWLYEYGFKKYDVGITTGLSDSELYKAARGLISYFNSGEEYIHITVMKDGMPFELFNQREITHLKDVKELIRDLDYRILIGSGIYFLGYAAVSLFRRKRKYWHRLARATVWGSGLTLAIMLALGLTVLFGFDQFFWQFHLLSFANDFWLLDPATDYLIMLFPGGFWYDATVFLVIATASGALVLGAIGLVYLSKTRSEPVRDPNQGR